MGTILHVDMDAFFVAVELLRHPELAGRAVVVGGRGDPAERGVVSTASYEARKWGVRSGMPLRTAHRLCPQAVFLPVDYRAYAKASKRIMAILHGFSRHVEEGGLDEAFLELTGTAAPEAVAQDIKREIRARTGLTCSVGIGPNKLLAKIASDLEKPDGLTRLEAADVPARLWPLPVGRLWGVGPKTAARLAALGVVSIGDLAAQPLETLTAQFGPAHGQALYLAARGLDESPVRARRTRKSLGNEATFQHDVTDREVLRRALEALVRKAAARLRQYHYLAGTVTVKLRLADFETHTCSLPLPAATDQADTVQAVALECLARLSRAKPVRLIGVRLGHLEHGRKRSS